MRENTKWIMLVTALAFVALMVFEWGMDITGRSAGSLGEIGRVNGTPIMYEDYMAAYRSLYDQVQQTQEEPITSQRNSEIEDQAFDEVVTQILLAQELDRRGIRVTDEEILQAARFNAPPRLQELPVFQTDGQFDLEKYQAYLASPGVDQSTLLWVENYYRTIIPRGKLMRQVTSGVFYTDDELWQRWRDDHETASIRYVGLQPGDRIPDEDVAIQEREMRSYYEDHQEDFEVPARARVRAVILRKAPTSADTAAAWEHARALQERLADGADFAELAREESADRLTVDQGGDLGVVAKDRMTPSLDSAIFATAAGSLAGPIRTRVGLHVVEVQERWGQDSARARHILVPFERTDDSEIALLTLADSLEELGETRRLGEAADILDVEVHEGEITEQFAFLAGAGQVGEGADWAFLEAAPGDVSPVFENSQAFYALELVGSTPGGIRAFEETRSEIREILLRRKKIARAEAEALEMVGRIRDGASLAEVAGEAGLEVREAGPFVRSDFVPGIGRHNAAVGAAFGLQPGEVSDPVTTEQDVFIIEKVGGTPADRTEWEAQKDAQRRALLGQAQQRRVAQWIESLRASARIVDRRDEVLQPAEEDLSTRPRTGLF